MLTALEKGLLLKGQSRGTYGKTLMSICKIFTLVSNGGFDINNHSPSAHVPEFRFASNPIINKQCSFDVLFLKNTHKWLVPWAMQFFNVP